MPHKKIKMYTPVLFFALIFSRNNTAMHMDFFNTPNPYETSNEPLFSEVEDLKLKQEHERNNELNKKKIKKINALYEKIRKQNYPDYFTEEMPDDPNDPVFDSFDQYFKEIDSYNNTCNNNSNKQKAYYTRRNKYLALRKTIECAEYKKRRQKPLLNYIPIAPFYTTLEEFEDDTGYAYEFEFSPNGYNRYTKQRRREPSLLSRPTHNLQKKEGGKDRRPQEPYTDTYEMIFKK